MAPLVADLTTMELQTQLAELGQELTMRRNKQHKYKQLYLEEKEKTNYLQKHYFGRYQRQLNQNSLICYGYIDIISSVAWDSIIIIIYSIDPRTVQPSRAANPELRSFWPNKQIPTVCIFFWNFGLFFCYFEYFIFLVRSSQIKRCREN